MTAAKLKARTVKELSAMAKKKKVPGWHAMRKDELVKALVRHARSQAAKAARRAAAKTNGKSTNGKSTNGHAKAAQKAGCNGASTNGRKAPTRSERRLKAIRDKLARSKDLAFRSVACEQEGPVKDRVVLMVRDPYWLHAYWELGRRGVERARAAMGQHWHGCRPVLRVNEVARTGTTNASHKLVRDITIHGGVNNWYIDVQDPPKSYQIEIGYLAPNGKFFCLARSNIVSTPKVGSSDTFDQNWSEVAKDCDRIYAMSGGYSDEEKTDDLKEILEERLRRPIGEPMASRYGIGAAGVGTRNRTMNFQVDTELIVHGMTDPNARVTFRGEPVPIRDDGSFAVRLNLPDRRHVLPVVASSGDGVEQRTIVLAVDRNTKVMEPVIRDPGE